MNENPNFTESNSVCCMCTYLRQGAMNENTSYGNLMILSKASKEA